MGLFGFGKKKESVYTVEENPMGYRSEGGKRPNRQKKFNKKNGLLSDDVVRMLDAQKDNINNPYEPVKRATETLEEMYDD